jgi:hypothetical protein
MAVVVFFSGRAVVCLGSECFEEYDFCFEEWLDQNPDGLGCLALVSAVEGHLTEGPGVFEVGSAVFFVCAKEVEIFWDEVG